MSEPDWVALDDLHTEADEDWYHAHYGNGDSPGGHVGVDHDLVGEGWTPVDLTAAELAVPPEPPAVHGILYRKLRHVISGESESAKTLFCYALLLEALRQGEEICIVDFEMGPHAARRLLDDLGATQQELARIVFFAPSSAPTAHDTAIVRAAGVTFVLIDAAAGAYDISGLDDNARREVEQWARIWVRPFWQHGIATLLVDHVTKDAKSRGKFAIGSERKIGQVEVHLLLESQVPFSRGNTGLMQVHVRKDRPGFLKRPTLGALELTSDPVTNQIGWQLLTPRPRDSEGHFRPTTLMAKVSRYLEDQTGTVTVSQIERDVAGKARALRAAVDCLVREGYAVQTHGPRGARQIGQVKRYTEEETQEETASPRPRPDPVPDPVPVPGAVPTDPVPHRVLLPQGRTTRDGVAARGGDDLEKNATPSPAESVGDDPEEPEY